MPPLLQGAVRVCVYRPSTYTQYIDSIYIYIWCIDGVPVYIYTQGAVRAAGAMLDAGLRPFLPDKHKNTPLHLAGAYTAALLR